MKIKILIMLGVFFILLNVIAFSSDNENTQGEIIGVDKNIIWINIGRHLYNVQKGDVFEIIDENGKIVGKVVLNNVLKYASSANIKKDDRVQIGYKVRKIKEEVAKIEKIEIKEEVAKIEIPKPKVKKFSGEVKTGFGEQKLFIKYKEKISHDTTFNIQNNLEQRKIVTGAITKDEYTQNNLSLDIIKDFRSATLQSAYKNRIRRHKTDPQSDWDDNVFNISLLKDLKFLNISSLYEIVDREYSSFSQFNYEQETSSFTFGKMLGKTNATLRLRHINKHFNREIASYKEDMQELKLNHTFRKGREMQLWHEKRRRKFPNYTQDNYKQSVIGMLFETKSRNKGFLSGAKELSRKYDNKNKYEEKEIHFGYIMTFGENTSLSVKDTIQRSKYVTQTQDISSRENKIEMGFNYQPSTTTQLLLENQLTNKKFKDNPDRSYKETIYNISFRKKLTKNISSKIRSELVKKTYTKEDTAIYNLNSKTSKYEISLMRPIGKKYISELKYQSRSDKYPADRTKNKDEDFLTFHLMYRF